MRNRNGFVVICGKQSSPTPYPKERAHDDEASSSGLFLVRDTATTHCRPRGEAWREKAPDLRDLKWQISNSKSEI